MQGKHEYQPELFSQIDYEHLIPKGHLLRRIDRVLDLSFLPILTKPLYSEAVGRPSIDPVVFVRMVLLGHLYGIESDRQLCEEVGYNLAYRWFCRLSLKDKVPDHSSMTRVRDRLGIETFERIFREVVEQCRKAGLVKMERVMMDGSVIRANASIYNMEEREKKDDDDDSPPSGPIYSKDGLSNNDFRQRKIEGKKISNKTHVSSSDPDATLSGKAGEAKSLAYKTHSAIDADSRVIIDCHLTTGAASEVKFFQERVEAIEKNLGQSIGEIIADRGYGSGDNLDYLERMEIRANIPLWSPRSGETFFRELEDGFKVNDGSRVECPAGHNMHRAFYDESTGRWMFTLPRSWCQACARFKSCLSGYEQKTRGKKFALIDHFKIIMSTRERSEQPEFKKKLWERMWKMEGIFAEGKNFHGLRRAKYRGLQKVQAQVYMISTVQNLKRLAGALLLLFRAILADLTTNAFGPENSLQIRLPA